MLARCCSTLPGKILKRMQHWLTDCTVHSQDKISICVGDLMPTGAKVPVRIKIKNIAVAQSQELLVLLWGHSGLAWEPDQLVLTCLRRKHCIALITRQI